MWPDAVRSLFPAQVKKSGTHLRAGLGVVAEDFSICSSCIMRIE